MEMTWPMKLKLAAAAAVGIVLLGIAGWPLVKPDDPFAALSLFTGSITVSDAVILAALAFLAGLIAYFFAWPYGREIAILAVPAGLAVWALRAGSMTELMEQNPTGALRGHLFSTLRYEPLFWLALIAAGFAGVLVANKLRPTPRPEQTGPKPPSGKPRYLLLFVSFGASIVLAEFLIGLLALDVTIPDGRLGSVVGQPAPVQIAFGIVVSFGLVAFAAKAFLKVGYIVPALASAFVTAFSVTFYMKTGPLEYLCSHWPAAFFIRPVFAILPVQMVAFGTLGGVAGYWLAIKYLPTRG